MKRITAYDLTNWAQTRDCQGHLPLLVRKLIRASGVRVIKILIPAGDNVVLPGYDGTVETAEGTEYIPSGKSVWEIGTSSDIKGKAELDYTKRTKEPDVDAAEKTFVFVTPRVWQATEKERWIADKQREGTWKDVMVIDGPMLEEWIEQYYAVGLWLARWLQHPMGTARSLDEFWKEWHSNSSYSISAELVVCAREEESKQLLNFFAAPAQTILIRASTPQEALAFVAATVELLGEEDREILYAKTCIVSSEHDFRILASQQAPMILLADLPVGIAANGAVAAGHHVVVAMGNDVSPDKVDIQLPRIKRDAFEKKLVDMGFSQEQADRLTSDSGQSLSVLRRLLRFDRDQRPDWACNGLHRDIIPALLAGMWDEGKEEDKLMVALLAGEPYEKYIAKLSRWKMEADPIVFQVKSVWRFTSPLDVWSVLAPYIMRSDLDNLRTVVFPVLTEVNPALQLEERIRHMANVLGKMPKFSHLLKEGLCQTLVLIGVFGKQFGIGGTEHPQGFIDSVVKALLDEAPADRWQSLNRSLPLVAEASPNAFLDAVERSLGSADKPIMGLFGTSDDPIFSAHYYASLLWALENLLYSKEYISRATLVLAHLAELDPGMRSGNKPIDTLVHAFIPWYKQTHTTLATRKAVLSSMAFRFPEVAWSLFRKLQPEDHAVVSPIHRCRWRFNTQTITRSVNYGELYEYYDFLFEHLFNLATRDENKTATLLSLYPNASENNREKIRDFLEGFNNDGSRSGGVIWEAIRQLIAHHREYAYCDWALPAEELDKLEGVFTLYLPATLPMRDKYLFEEEWPDFTEGTGGEEIEHDKKEKILLDKRNAFFLDLYAREGFAGVKAVTASLERSSIFAFVVATHGLNAEEEKEVLGMLSKDVSDKWTVFAETYLRKRAFDLGEAWLENAWKIVQELHGDPLVQVRFFLACIAGGGVWKLLDTASEDVQTMYWQQLNPYFDKGDAEFITYQIGKLQAVGRHMAILEAVWMVAEELPSSVITEVLFNAGMMPEEKIMRTSGYRVSRLFDLLNKRSDVDEQVMSNLEWLYIPVFDRSERKKPKVLYKQLTNNPDFFIEMVSLMYQPDEGETEEEWDKRYKLAGNARILLDNWRDVPGLREDGSIDGQQLSTWVKTVREKAITAHRVYGVDSQVGNLLASYPRKTDEWPPDEICEILDTINSETMLSHFRTQIFNSRGVTVRSPYAGGEQERALAARFRRMGERITHRYAITAKILFEMAVYYEADARDEDESARLDELR